MNELARKKARRAELEYYLLGACDEEHSKPSFVEWLGEQAQSATSWWVPEAMELIALYEEGL